jgi:hypothetical protein
VIWLLPHPPPPTTHGNTVPYFVDVISFLGTISIDKSCYYLQCKDDFLNVEVKEGELAVAIDKNGRIAAVGNYTEVRSLSAYK